MPRKNSVKAVNDTDRLNVDLDEQTVLAKCDPAYHGLCKEMAAQGVNWNSILAFIVELIPKVIELLREHDIIQTKSPEEGGEESEKGDKGHDDHDPRAVECLKACVCKAECLAIESLAHIHAAKHAAAYLFRDNRV